MSKFDQKVNQILDEGLLSFAGKTAQAIKNPAAAWGNVLGSMEKNKQQQEELKGQPFSGENPPQKEGQLVITKAPVFGAVQKRANTLPEAVVLNPNVPITGKITKLMDQQGNYGVALTDEKGNPSQKYVFAQIESAPFWQVYDVTKIPDPYVKIDQKGIPMMLTAIMTGLAKDDVSDSLRSWSDYRNFLKQKKK
jgi:hypothetical protein